VAAALVALLAAISTHIDSSGSLPAARADPAASPRALGPRLCPRPWLGLRGGVGEGGAGGAGAGGGAGGAAGWDAGGDLIDLQQDSSDIPDEGTAGLSLRVQAPSVCCSRPSALCARPLAFPPHPVSLPAVPRKYAYALAARRMRIANAHTCTHAAVPGAGVAVEEGYRERQAWLQAPEEQRQVEQLLCPSWEQAVRERELWLAEHPDYVEPLNDTWFFEVRRGNVTTLRELLHRGADVEWPDDYGDRAIHLAAIDNSTDVLRFLLSAGASVNARNRQGNTALHIATEFGQTAMQLQLIAGGADLEMRNLAKATAVVTACVHGQVDALRVLAAAGADIHTRALKGATALHLAAANNHAAAVRVMIKLGADANATTPLGRNAMDWAHYSNQSDAAQELAAHGVPVQDGAMLPMLEIQKWAGEKRARAAAKQKQASDGGPRATETSDGGGVEAGRVGGGGGREQSAAPDGAATDGWFPRAKPEPLVFACAHPLAQARVRA